MTAAIEEFFAKWKPQFERAQSGAREELSNQLAERQDEFLRGLKAEFEENFGKARKLMDELHPSNGNTARGKLKLPERQPAAWRRLACNLRLWKLARDAKPCRSGKLTTKIQRPAKTAAAAWRQTLTQ